MWVRITSENKLAFLINDQGFVWTGHRFDAIKTKLGHSLVRVRTSAGVIREYRLADLQFDSEAVYNGQRDSRAFLR